MGEPTFQEAYPLALRAIQVRSVAAVKLVGLKPEDCEDFQQELLTAVWQALKSYDPSRASLRTFVEVVVQSQFSSLLRSRLSRRPTVAMSDLHIATLDGIPQVELQVDIERVANSLNQRDRRVVEILFEDTPSETARQLGIARTTVYAGIRRLRDALRAAGYAPEGGTR